LVETRLTANWRHTGTDSLPHVLDPRASDIQQPSVTYIITVPPNPAGETVSLYRVTTRDFVVDLTPCENWNL